MANQTIEPGRPKKIRRIQIGFNVLAQIILILFLAAMVNSIAFKHYERWDFSRDQKYALADKTKRFLRTIKGKMRITVFFSPSTPITADVQNLLTEYQYAAKGKIDIEHIDPERNLSRAKELFDKYKVVSDESLLVLVVNDQKTFVADDFVLVEQLFGARKIAFGIDVLDVDLSFRGVLILGQQILHVRRDRGAGRK